ncbi:molybdopterin-dependent oxidoreductase [Micromonospora sp. ANENR4]|uniref:molybdopterin cofactor-binding domain-containing protein n=1 Tax=unclassified Micromonospora TaxID=2617518 RepID=UPI00188E1B33|nr:MULTISPECIES: molybdopterin cofactor-binding domain-containing protein [unclassified Micromonospora]MBF5033660.1 molybdopterin-dependent oxidoreductase [Micromonospora sp. ANENR4]MCZ7476265.1 molybdopterin-dependent oxidoreductase [Micromonospora sp. WMMC273]
MSAVTGRPVALTVAGSAGIGASPRRPDGMLKARGEFAYSSDLRHPQALFGATLRSPHARARIVSIRAEAARRLAGVHAVLTHGDLPAARTTGLDRRDQPVLAGDRVRYQGEPVALVAAEDAATARRAVALIEVEYAVETPLTDPWRSAFDPDAPLVHDEYLNVVRHQRIRRGEVTVPAAVVVRGEYRVGMQDQAFLGPESGLALPAGDGGVELLVATQWLHVDRDQLAAVLGLPPEKVRLTLAGVGGAFGAREDLSMQAHACLLALTCGRPVRMAYLREESFVGHVHRHPAILRYEHGADHDGRLVYVRAEVILDGGAYQSSTAAVVGNAASLGVGPYEVPNVLVDVYGVYTNNPPCGAMRGFGAVQTCFAYESQMDRLARACGLEPLEVRARNAVRQGSRIATGQLVDAPIPIAEILDAVRATPLPPPVDPLDPRDLPGGIGATTGGEGVRRGVGYGIGIKNICYSEGFDDHSTARLRLELRDDGPTAIVHTAAAEVGQGLQTVLAQIVATELPVDRVEILPADTDVGSAGSTSASRQSYMTGGAVQAACGAISARLAAVAARHFPGRPDVPLAELLRDGPVEETREFRHRPTVPLDADGQGASHVQFAVCAHRAVVDVDVDLGLVRVVELAAAQDVGRILHPVSLAGQIHGGSAQGLGLALLEEAVVVDGVIRNPSFTDYLIPTMLDMPEMTLSILEHPDPHAPYGLRGAGEPPTLSSTPAIVAAVRDATGVDLHRVPVRPQDLTTAPPPETWGWWADADAGADKAAAVDRHMTER